jgi:hypothetical protein
MARLEGLDREGKDVVSPSATPRYRKLSHRDVLRWGDEFKSPSGKWLPVYARATGSIHTVGSHPWTTPGYHNSMGTEYRRPIYGQPST